MDFAMDAKASFDALSQAQQAEVLKFIRLLSAKTEGKQRKSFPFDIFAGGMTYMAEDFDETPECFKEYV